MMKRAFLLACPLLLLAAGAAAQIDPDPDGIGIYADLGATRTRLHAPVEQPFEVYLMLTRPSAVGSIAGWSARIVVPENAVIWGWNVAGDHWMNVGSPPIFEVAYNLASSLPLQDVILLMTFIIYLTDHHPAEFYIERSYDIYEWPCYLDTVDLGTFIQLHPWPRGSNQPAFCANPAPGTPVLAATMGAVKNLYR
jgi:hypothetical protein